MIHLGRSTLTYLALIAGVGCSADLDGTSSDRGGPHDGATDAGPSSDASRPDEGGPQDSGARDVVGELDGGSGDARAEVDGSGRDAAGTGEAGPSVDGGLTLGERCFPEIFDPTRAAPNYDQYHPVIEDGCAGTHHQDIQGVERVVFLGDSVTVGTPPTPSAGVYRALLADALAARFGLAPPSALWRTANPLTGEASTRTSGAFSSCAKWGARVDDLMRDDHQVEDCLPETDRSLVTLVIITIGGNDVASFTKDGAHASYAESRQRVEEFVGLLRETLLWLKTPGRFPNGVHVVFTNLYEFTDGTADMASCPAASVAGFTEPWDHPEDLEALMIWANEQYLAMAVETGSDMVFSLESFCGHGFHNEDPAARCYRGPGTPRWFDVSCIHPNPEGHQALADLFMSVIDG